MCQGKRKQPKSTCSEEDDTISTTTVLRDNDSGGSKSFIRPIHPLLLLAIAPLLPTWFFMNRGYTQWFHWTFIFYFMTGKRDFWRRFLVLQGAAVSVGWYAAVIHDYMVHDRLCHLLYNNMPPNMRALMLVDGNLASGGIIWDNWSALSMIASSHMIDFIAHPLLTYVAWRIHSSHGGTMRNLVTWNVFWSSSILTRIYSVAHMYYNDGEVTGLYYYGFDVYNIDDLESYTVAYIAEGLCFVAFAAWKVYVQWIEVKVKVQIGNENHHTQHLSSSPVETLSNETTAKVDDGTLDRQKPRLIQSDSSFSSQYSFLENLKNSVQ